MLRLQATRRLRTLCLRNRGLTPRLVANRFQQIKSRFSTVARRTKNHIPEAKDQGRHIENYGWEGRYAIEDAAPSYTWGDIFKTNFIALGLCYGAYFVSGKVMDGNKWDGLGLAMNSRAQKEFDKALESMEGSKACAEMLADQIVPLKQQLAEAEFNALSDPSDETAEALASIRKEYKNALTNPTNEHLVAKMQKFLDEYYVLDPLETRQIERAFREFFAARGDLTVWNDIISLQDHITNQINAIRDLTAGDASSDDPALRELAFESRASLAQVLTNDVRKLGLARNKIATSLGFDNWHQLNLFVNNQRQSQATNIYNEIAVASAAHLNSRKQARAEAVAGQFGVSVDELEAWHFDFASANNFNSTSNAAADGAFADVDSEALARGILEGVGFSTEIEFANGGANVVGSRAIAIDREGDVRVVGASCGNNGAANTAAGVVNAFGQAAYLKAAAENSSLPAYLRDISSGVIAGGVGDLLARQAFIGGDVDVEDGKAALFNELVDAAARAQVSYRFEKAFYENPNNPELNNIYWDLLEKYQGVKANSVARSHSYWALHGELVDGSQRSHNDLLGKVFASQLHLKVARNLKEEPGFAVAGNEDVGTFITNNIFTQGANNTASDVVRETVAADLSARPFVRDINRLA